MQRRSSLSKNKRNVLFGLGTIAALGSLAYGIAKVTKAKNDRATTNIVNDFIPANHKYDVSGMDQLTQLLANASNKRVFILFYAPWCPDCRSALPLIDDIIQNSNILDKDNDTFINPNGFT